MQEPEDLTASHRIHIHLFQAPAAVLTDDDGHVRALRTERTRLTGDGNVTGTGEYRDWPVQAVYRAVGYASSPIEGLPLRRRASCRCPTRAGACSARMASP